MRLHAKMTNSAITDQKSAVALDYSASLDYEAEYFHIKDELAKVKEENQYLRHELDVADKNNQWHSGFEAAVKLIFGKRINED